MNSDGVVVQKLDLTVLESDPYRLKISLLHARYVVKVFGPSNPKPHSASSIYEYAPWPADIPTSSGKSKTSIGGAIGLFPGRQKPTLEVHPGGEPMIRYIETMMRKEPATLES